jgi:hypothetical protein
MNRRGFLKKSVGGIGGAYLMASPLNMMLANVLTSVFQRAWALEQGEGSFLDQKLINISMDGGPSRWVFDLPLRPNGNDAFQYNTNNDQKSSMIFTRLVADPTGPGGFVGEYATTQVGDYHLPIMWSGKIPTADGGVENMSALAQNMLFMRGIKAIDNHSLSQTLQTNPSGPYSTGGAIADRATAVLPALSLGARPGGYKSSKGIVPQALQTDNNNTLVDAFNPFSAAMALKSNGSTAEAIDRALDVMRDRAGSKHKMIPYTFQDRINARKLMTTQFSNLATVYGDLRTKYRTLITRSLTEAGLRLAGVDDLVIAGSSIPQFSIQNGGGTTFFTGANLNSIMDQTSMIGRLAETMAVAEFMVCGSGYGQSFTSSIHANIGGLGGCLFDALTTDGVLSSNQRLTLTNDAHGTGAYVQLVQFTRFFRAISACLHEFVKRLKATSVGSGNLFDRTVIALHSEFNRSARDAGGGADHGPNGSCYTLLSGKVAQPLVVGDINRNGGQNGYRGTWGTGAPMTEFSGQTAVVGNAASTVALMMGFPSPTPNNASFVSVNATTGKVSPAVGRAKNVG